MKIFKPREGQRELAQWNLNLCYTNRKKKDIWVFKSRFHKDFRRVLFWVCGVHEQYILKSQCKDNHARRKKWFDPQNIWFLFHKHRTILKHEDRSIHIHVHLKRSRTITNDTNNASPPFFFTDLQISNVVGVFFSALFKQ